MQAMTAARDRFLAETINEEEIDAKQHRIDQVRARRQFGDSIFRDVIIRSRVDGSYANVEWRSRDLPDPGFRVRAGLVFLI